MVTPAAQTIPLSWHLPVQGVPVGIAFSINGAEGQVPGSAGLFLQDSAYSCHSLPLFRHTHTEEEQFRPKDV